MARWNRLNKNIGFFLRPLFQNLTFWNILNGFNFYKERAWELRETWRKEKRVKEFDRWLKHEARDILLAHTNPVCPGGDFARSGGLTRVFLGE
jgi:hypothetical protein